MIKTAAINVQQFFFEVAIHTPERVNGSVWRLNKYRKMLHIPLENRSTVSTVVKIKKIEKNNVCIYTGYINRKFYNGKCKFVKNLNLRIVCFSENSQRTDKFNV